MHQIPKALRLLVLMMPNVMLLRMVRNKRLNYRITAELLCCWPIECEAGERHPVLRHRWEQIAYLDASALVKRYVAEAGSAEVVELIDQAEAVGTAVISRAEVAAALAKASRIRVLPRDEAVSALKLFNSDWEYLVRLQMTEGMKRSKSRIKKWMGCRKAHRLHFGVDVT